MELNQHSSPQPALSELDRPTHSSQVGAMFDSIAHRYDLLNWLLSGGMHKVWERRLVASLPRIEQGVCLDLCTGTGALVPALAERYARVVGVDISKQMLSVAQRRYARLSNVEWRHGDAQSLELASNSFDAVTVAYGVRNWPDREAGLREIARVLRIGGRVAILEFGQPRNAIWRGIFQIYSRYVIPLVGGALSGNRAAYEYLPKTSAVFPCGDAFAEMLSRAELVTERCVPLMGGIAFLYLAVKSAPTASVQQSCASPEQRVYEE